MMIAALINTTNAESQELIESNRLALLAQQARGKPAWKRVFRDLQAAKEALARETAKASPLASDPCEMILVEGGTFIMGDTFSKQPAEDALPHMVTLDSFKIAVCEITEAELARVLNWAVEQEKISVKGDVLKNNEGVKHALSHISILQQKDNYPVSGVSWFGAAAYCNYRSELEGLSPCYTISGFGRWECNFDANGYRLPTEAEWEYASRGGRKGRNTQYSGSNDLKEVGWYSNDNGRTLVYYEDRKRVITSYTSEPDGTILENNISWDFVPTISAGWVGKALTQLISTKKPNELGLYDLSGNVAEWCYDHYGAYKTTPEHNPIGKNRSSFDTLVTVRGGSVNVHETACRVDTRAHMDAENMQAGFRVVQSVLPRTQP